MAVNDNWTFTTSDSGDVLTCVPAVGFDALDTTLLVTPNTIWTSGMYVHSIEFDPSAVNDVLVVRDGSATGAIIMGPKDVLGGGLLKVFNQFIVSREAQKAFHFKPYLVAANQTFTTPANVRIIFHAVPVKMLTGE